MKSSTGIVIGFSALAGLVAVWGTIATFDPNQTGEKRGVEHGTAPRTSPNELSRLWMIGDDYELLRRAGLWTADHPDAVWPRYYRACVVAQHLGRDPENAWRRLLEASERQIAAGVDDQWTHFFMGVALVRLGRADEAPPVFDSSLERFERPGHGQQNLTNHYIRANVAALLGRTDEALDHLEQALENSGENAFIRGWVAHDPDLDMLGDDPRFIELVARYQPQPD